MAGLHLDPEDRKGPWIHVGETYEGINEGTLMTNDKTKKVVVGNQLLSSPSKSFSLIALKKLILALMG